MPAIKTAGPRRGPVPTHPLATPLQFVKGIGPQRAKLLGNLGLRTVEDALYYLPVRHEDRSQLTNDVFLKALKLGHVGIYPGQPERYFVLDFTLGSHFTDEVLVASADEDGVVDDEILWES